VWLKNSKQNTGTNEETDSININTFIAAQLWAQNKAGLLTLVQELFIIRNKLWK